MKHQFTAIIEPGEQFVIATCPEVPEAHGQGTTREECLKDLADSIQSVLEYRREQDRRNWDLFVNRCKEISVSSLSKRSQPALEKRKPF